MTGRDAEQVLQWLCTADVAVAPGRTVYTGMLNARGTYEADITVTRLSADEFLLVSSAATTERDKDHITRRMPAGAARVAGRRHLRLRRLRRHGPAVAGAAVPALPQRPRRRGLPVRLQPRDRPRLRHGPRDPDHLRRRARLGAVRPGRVRRRRLRGPGRGGRRARPGQRRLLRDRVAAPGEGLPGLRPRADAGLQPGRGRPAVRLQAQDRHRFLGREAVEKARAAGPGAGWSRSCCEPTPPP